MEKAKLKEGVVLRPYGPQSSITNENLTDALASFFLTSGKARKEDFEVLPETLEPVELTPVNDEHVVTETKITANEGDGKKKDKK